MSPLRRWGYSVRIAGLMGGLCVVSPVLGQELPKLPTLPVTPPSIPAIPEAGKVPTPPPAVPAIPSIPTVPAAPASSQPPAPAVPAAPVIPAPAPTKPTPPAKPEAAPVVPAKPPMTETPPAKPATPPPPTTSKPTFPPGYIPPADTDPKRATPPRESVGKVSFAMEQEASTSLPTALSNAREAHSKLRDYVGFLVRQERVGGKLLAEQTCELRVLTKPLCVSVKVIAPKDVAGQDTVYNPTRWLKVKHLANGLEGIRYGYQNLSLDDSKVMANTRHPLNEVGLLAVLDRVEKALANEKKLNHPVQVLKSDFTFLGRPCTRYEIFADKPHPGRYAQRMVLFVDEETRLPVRFEAYNNATTANPAGELVEMASFVNLKFNVGLGVSTFDR